MYQMFLKRHLRDVFPMCTLLCNYLTLMISNCIVFCKLKLIKDEHQCTMSLDRLVHLTMLSTEWDVMRPINLDNILSDFSGTKSAKIYLVFENGQYMKNQISLINMILNNWMPLFVCSGELEIYILCCIFL